jgi:hypothetical protein
MSPGRAPPPTWGTLARLREIRYMRGMGRRARGHAVWAAAAIIAVPIASAPIAAGCKARAEPTIDPEESQERLNVISNPSMYLDTSGLDFDNDASDYEQLLAMTVWNKSRFAVHGLEGDVGWFDDEGHRLGSSPFTLTGPVAAHSSAAFSISDGSMTSGTLRGGALRVAITFTHVKVDE